MFDIILHSGLPDALKWAKLCDRAPNTPIAHEPCPNGTFIGMKRCLRGKLRVRHEITPPDKNRARQTIERDGSGRFSAEVTECTLRPQLPSGARSSTLKRSASESCLPAGWLGRNADSSECCIVLDQVFGKGRGESRSWSRGRGSRHGAWAVRCETGKARFNLQGVLPSTSGTTMKVLRNQKRGDEFASEDR
jgi:hypothetical protein